MNLITWTLHPNAAQSILNILGDLPTKSGAFNLLQDLAQQTQNQIALAEQNAAKPAAEAAAPKSPDADKAVQPDAKNPQAAPILVPRKSLKNVAAKRRG